MSDEEARLSAILPPVGHVVAETRLRDRVTAPLRLAKALAQVMTQVRALKGTSPGSAELRQSMRGILRALGIELEVFGAERLSDSGQVLMWNQASHLDHLALAAAIPVPFRSVYNVEVSRIEEAEWRRSVHNPAGWIYEGNTVLVSPEGTRSWDGRILPMKRGAFILAAAAKKPIIPVVVYGTQAALPRGRFLVCPGRIEIEFREPIATFGVEEHERKQLKSAVATVFRQALAEGPPSARAARL